MRILRQPESYDIVAMVTQSLSFMRGKNRKKHKHASTREQINEDNKSGQCGGGSTQTSPFVIVDHQSSRVQACRSHLKNVGCRYNFFSWMISLTMTIFRNEPGWCRVAVLHYLTQLNNCGKRIIGTFRIIGCVEEGDVDKRRRL